MGQDGVIGKASRAKGVAGERESANVFRKHGFEVVRLQNNVLDAGDFTATIHGDYDDSSGFHGEGCWHDGVTLLVDSKRRERLHLLAASRQIEAVARDGQVPVLAYRSNREPWRASLLLADFARLLGTT